jgi:hypothetical protein
MSLTDRKTVAVLTIRNAQHTNIPYLHHSDMFTDSS